MLFEDNRPLNTRRCKTMKQIIYSGSILEKILNSKKIKYKVLNELLYKRIPPNKDTVNIFIDVNDVFNSFYNPENLDKFKSTNDAEKMSISSELLNIGAHYRNYFATRHDMYTNIFYYYSFEEDVEGLNISSTYREDFYNKRVRFNPEFHVINEVLVKQIKVFEIIAKYIPHLYAINTKQTNPLIAPTYINKYRKDNEFTILYTNDKLHSLSISHDLDSFLLTARGDKSKLINSLDLNEYLIKKKNYDYNFSTNLLPYIFAIAGYKKYNIEGISGYGLVKSANLLQKLINEGYVSDIDYKDPNLFIEDLQKGTSVFSETDLEKIQQNIKLIKPQLILDKITEVDIMNIMDFTDLMDSKSLHALNAKYYEKYPILLEEIMMGEEYE